MNRISLSLSALCVLITLQLNAQSGTHFTASAGIGLLPTYFKGSEKSTVPPLSFRLGYQVNDVFNVGTYIGYTETTSKERLLYDGLASHLENKTLMMGFRSEFRRALTDQMDLYGGITLGYSKVSTKEINASNGQLVQRSDDEPTPYDPNPSPGQMFYSGFIGTSWYFQKNIGAFAEVGVGISLANLGLKVRI